MSCHSLRRLSMKTFLFRATIFGAVACVLAADPATPAPAKVPTIQLKDESGTAIDVSGLPKKDLEAVQAAKLTTEQWTALFAVYVDRGDGKERKDQLAMLGTYSVVNDLLRFEPRFPLVRGVHYRVVFDAAKLPGHDKSNEKPIETVLFIPKPKTLPTVVERIYPTRDDLPENQLKFYIHFSAPMSRGEAYANIKLLDDKGKPIDNAFLELDQELWDPDMKRFTLLIEPGRIKQGLKPREDLGPVLEKGKTYTLVVEKGWSDGNDEPLKESFKKTFRAVAADETQPDPQKWKLQTPAAQTTKPLMVMLGKSLDHALLHDCLWIENDEGQRVAGTIEVTDKEAVWRFEPKEAWKTGKFQLVVDTGLEDLAGNNIARPFEVDVTKPFQREMKTETKKIAFEVK
jgi:hypothetical protein